MLTLARETLGDDASCNQEVMMRTVLFVSTLLIAPGVALAGAQQCALPLAGGASAALPVPVIKAGAEAPSPETAMPVPRIGPDDIARVPALQRIASNGAALFDLGTAHGLRSVFARRDNVFQVFYITADGEAAIGGVMWSSKGQNLTRRQVSPIEGTIPTVTIGMPAAPAAGTPTAALPSDRPAVSALKVAEAASFGTTGAATAPRLWVFIDPLCSFSVRAMAQLQPYVESGKVQLAVIPISLLDGEDHGRSTLAAKAMLSFPPDAMVAAWLDDKLTGPAGRAADVRLATNMRAEEAIALRGTPTFLWRKAGGGEGRSDGLPDDLDAVIASLGN